jgi:hypothetical protein
MNIKSLFLAFVVVWSPYGVSGQKNAQEELLVPGHNLFVNQINVLHARFPTLDGSGLTVSLKENLFDTTDVDLKGRIRTSTGNINPVRTHASIMASLIAGAGNAGIQGQGVAPGAKIVHNNFDPLLPASDDWYRLYDVSVQNHSYGDNIRPDYASDARAYDESVALRPALLHVFSSGNSGDQSAPSGLYQNITGYANLTGSFKQAKNALVVGAVDSFGVPAFFSSRGPAGDGRLKPDLVAYGHDGSSESAALVSGVALILQQIYSSQNSGILPPAAWTRAMLINSADDAGSPGIDYVTGFGNMNARRAVQTAIDQHFRIDSIDSAATVTYQADVPPTSGLFTITLAWDDLPANPGTAKALVNDLDLTITAPDGTVFLPWVLNKYPAADSLARPATRGRDTLNNAEQISIDHPLPGTYQIRVTASLLESPRQAYALVFDHKAADSFLWTSPVQGDPVVSGSQMFLRWEQTLDAPVGRLEYHLTSIPGWTPIQDSIPLSSGMFPWNIPNVFSEGQVRMIAGTQIFTSDTFLIAPEMKMEIGFNCPDSVMLFWKPVAPNVRYALYGLGSRYMESLRITSDTFAILQKQAFPQKRFAVAPVGNSNIQGQRSTAPDIGDQGVACYFKSFLAEQIAVDSIRTTLEIGTTYGLKRIAIQTWNGVGFSDEASWTPGFSTTFRYTEPNPVSGLHQYLAILELNNGVTLYSEVEIVYLPGSKGWLALPNPVAGNGSLTLITDAPGDTQFRLWDATGRLILEKSVDDAHVQIQLPGIPPGIYAVQIRKAGAWFGGKIIVGK